MATFNKTEQAIIDSINIKRHPNIELNFRKTGKVKDGNIRYTYYIMARFSMPWGFGYRNVYDSEEFVDIEIVAKDVITHYQKTLDSGIHNEKIYTEDGQRYICGRQVYGHAAI